ncbi:hypothetical protein SprV_0100177300 [Sparganum proliferum]
MQTTNRDIVDVETSYKTERRWALVAQAAEVNPLTLATSIVRFLLGNPRSNRPERRTVLVSRELVHHKVDIAALSKTRFSKRGELGEVGAGYTFFWSGRPKAQRRDADVAFATRNDIVGRLLCLPQNINDRMISLRLSLRGGKFATIVSVHAPSMNSTDAVWNEFHDDLHAPWHLCRSRDLPTATQLTSSNEPAQRLTNVPITADENASVENRWCQLSHAVRSTALNVLGNARPQHQDCFDDNDVTVNNLLIEKNCLRKAYVNRSTNDNKAAFYRSRRLVQQRLRHCGTSWDPHFLQDRRPTLQSAADALPVASSRDRPRTSIRRRLRPQRHLGRGHVKEHGPLAAACDNFGLVINTERTVVMHQPPPDAAYVAPQINVNGAQLQAVAKFTYLRSTLPHNTKINDEEAHRFPRPAKLLAVRETQFGIDIVSTSTPNWRRTRRSSCRLCCMERRPARCTINRREYSTTSTSAVFDGY